MERQGHGCSQGQRTREGKEGEHRWRNAGEPVNNQHIASAKSLPAREALPFCGNACRWARLLDMRCGMPPCSRWIAGLVLVMAGGVCVTQAPIQTVTSQRHYVGSDSCRKCHASVYASWK